MIDPTSPLEFVFVDTSVNDYQDLLSGITPSNSNGQMMKVTFDQSVDGIQKISETLSQYAQEISAVHIVTHGDAGSVQLGSSVLNSQNLNQYKGQLSTWGKALTSEGDILFYGCNVAQGAVGQQFVDELTGLTGADIAASDDLTGNADLGGDWDLEVETGTIDTPILFDQAVQASYKHNLATLKINNDGGIDTNKNVIKWGTTINDSNITILDFSAVKSNLTIEVLSNGNVEITRSSGSPSKITASLSYITEIIGTKASLKDTDLDLSAITADTIVTITRQDAVEVDYGGTRILKFKKIDDIIGASGASNLYKVEPDGNIKGNLIARGTNNVLQYIGNQTPEVVRSQFTE